MGQSIKQTSIGIRAIACEIPETKISLTEMAEKLAVSEEALFSKIGVLEKPVARPEIEAYDLGVAAAKKLIAKFEIDPATIDVIIYCSAGVIHKYLWSPAASVQQEIKAEAAFSFEMVNGCNTINTGLHVAKNWLLSHKTAKRILLVTGETLSRHVDYEDKDHIAVFPFSDAGSAVLLEKGWEKNLLLDFEAKTVAKFSDHMFVGKDSPKVNFASYSEADNELVRYYEKMYPYVISKVLENGKGGIKPAKIFMNQGDHRLIKKMPRLTGMEEHLFYRSHNNYGHMGGTDILFGLNDEIESGNLKKGDHVVLAASALGFSWGAQLLEI